MEFDNKRILIAAQYAPPYGGNFIPSLRLLSRKLESLGANVSFAFPKSAADSEWAHNLESENEVFFTGNSQTLVTQDDLKNIPHNTVRYRWYKMEQRLSGHFIVSQRRRDCSLSANEEYNRCGL